MLFITSRNSGVVVIFNTSDKQTDFGLGIYLYFYYIKICLIISIICIGLASISTIIFSQKYYYSDLNDYCNLILNNDSNLADNFKKDCTKFSSNETEIYSNIIQIDWLISMSAHNIKNYHDIFEYNTTDDEKNKIEDINLDYSFMYFLTGITILIFKSLFKDCLNKKKIIND